jgi:hypothetical protein
MYVSGKRSLKIAARLIYRNKFTTNEESAGNRETRLMRSVWQFFF